MKIAPPMKYERPEVIILEAKKGFGWCADGSGASLGGGDYMYCIGGSSNSGSATYCNSGASNTTPAEQCNAGGAVDNPPSCFDGGAPI